MKRGSDGRRFLGIGTTVSEEKELEEMLDSLRKSYLVLCVRGGALDWNDLGFTAWSDSMLVANLGDARYTSSKWRRIALRCLRCIESAEHVRVLTKPSKIRAALDRLVCQTRLFANSAVAETPKVALSRLEDEAEG